MPLTIAVLKETAQNENRVAANPDSIKKYIANGFKVSVQKGAGEKASFTDQSYKDIGATIKASATETLKSADIILCVQTPDAKTLASAKKGAILIGALDPFKNEAALTDFNKSDITAIAMEFMPRITRAQSMDILSSQANLAGYRAVIDGAHEFGQAFPMMMTAAGTVPPAKVFVMGAGVAGLQAIATAKRLGAVVSATDVRPAAKEQVESLGGSFVAVEDEEFKAAEDAGGYAKEMSKAYQKKQAELVAETLKKQDIVITTALIPGRPAPELVSEAMVKTMKPGSVIVDLAAPNGGNCALTQGDKIIEKYGVKIIGYTNMPSRVANNASALYARNLMTFVNSIYNNETKSLDLNFEDEILKAVTLTHGGKTVHEKFKTIKKNTPKKAPAKKATTKKTAPKTKTTTTKKATSKKAAPKSKTTSKKTKS